MKKTTFCLFFFFIPFVTFTQNPAIDSLEQVLAFRHSDSGRVTTLNALSSLYIEKNPDKATALAQEALLLSEKLKNKAAQATALSNLGNSFKAKAEYEKALIYLEHALKLRKEIKSPKAISDSYNEIGNVLWSQGKLDEALKFIQQALDLKNIISDDPKTIAFAYNSAGGIYSDKGEYIKALEYYFKTQEILEKINYKQKLPVIYNNIGNIYRYQQKNDKALQYYLKALAIAKEIDNKKSIAQCYNKIGVVYDNLEKHEEAISYYLQSLQIKEELGDKKGMGESFNNIGVVYKYKKEYDKSLAYLLKGMKIKEDIGDKKGLINSYSNIGSVYAQKKNFPEAIQYLEKGLNCAKEVGAKDMIRDTYYMFSEAYALQNNFAKAYEYQLRYDSIKDKVLDESTTNKITEMQTKYESEKKENEIKLLKQNERIKTLEIEEQKLQIQKRNYTLLGISLLLIGLLSGAYFWYGKQQLKNKLAQEIAIKETEENERLRIAKDIHDDLGSGLSKINFLSELVFKQPVLQPDVKGNVEAISETAKRMVDNMRDLIWALNPENATLSSLIARVREYSYDYLEDFPIELKATYPDDIPELPINKESHRGIFMVVKESLNNIVKHSFASEITLVSQITATNFSITIEDNGIGFDSSQYSSGNGLRNVKNRIIAAGGDINVQSKLKKGTRISITIPLEQS